MTLNQLHHALGHDLAIDLRSCFLCAMIDATAIISSVGLAVATFGGAVALYNARKGVLWKRAELANSNIKELLTNEELVFACRCMDWYGGVLVVPKSLQPLLKDDARTIFHDRDVYERAIAPELYLDEMEADPRLQIYRTSTDTLLSWLSATESAIKRKLYTVDDIEDAGYWLRKAYEVPTMRSFIEAFEYDKPLDSLAKRFAIDLPKSQRSSRGGFGSSTEGRSVDG